MKKLSEATKIDYLTRRYMWKVQYNMSEAERTVLAGQSFLRMAGQGRRKQGCIKNNIL